MRIAINLATRTIYDSRLVSRLCMVAVVLLAVLLAWNFLRFARNLGEMRRLDSEISAADKRLRSAPPGISEQEHAAIKQGVSFFNAIINRKTYGWLAFLERLENVTPDGVTLSLLSPDKRDDIIKIEGLARNFRALENFLEMLEDSGAFHDVLLLSHKNEEFWEQARGVRFSISCKVNRQ
jgi:type IV pilus assembly protein PilN